MTMTEKLMNLRDVLKETGPANALVLLEQLITEQHLDVIYPEQAPYRDTLGRLKMKPIDQMMECVHLCSCCKVIE